MNTQQLRERLLGRVPQPIARDRYAISQIWRIGTGDEPAGEEVTTNPLTPIKSEAVDAPPAKPEPGQKPLELQEPLELVAESLWSADQLDRQIQELTSALAPIEALAASTAQRFESLKVFQQRIGQLARTLEPMKASLEQLEQLARQFEPMKALHHQLARIPEEIRVHLVTLTKSLAPAIAFHLRLLELAKTFEPIDELAASFAGLAQAFRLNSSAENPRDRSVKSEADTSPLP